VGVGFFAGVRRQGQRGLPRQGGEFCIDFGREIGPPDRAQRTAAISGGKGKSGSPFITRVGIGLTNSLATGDSPTFEGNKHAKECVRDGTDVRARRLLGHLGARSYGNSPSSRP
jgi:hypothetical protein